MNTKFEQLNIEENYPMSKLTTFGIGGPAKYFIKIKNVEELEIALEFADENKLEFLIVGGGSNMVVNDKGFEGLVIKMENKGFEVVKPSFASSFAEATEDKKATEGETEDDNQVRIKIGSGEVWDEVVQKIVAKGWWGVENLSSVPGRMGALAVQNSGAYGVEAKDVIDKVETYDTVEKKIKIFTNEECRFAYRKSIFNNEAKGRYIILNTILKVRKQGKASINYPSVVQYFKDRNIEEPTLPQIRGAIIEIRKDKLPNWEKQGSAGSFFKNVVLSDREFENLENKIKTNFSEEEVAKLEEIKDEFVGDKGIKIPTAWLIEICGLKGAQIGGAKVHEKQPLIIVNREGKAIAKDVMELFKKIRQTVYKKTGIEILPEPNLIGFSKNELDYYFELN